MTSPRKIIFVTGLSGAGISTTLKALEDCGFEVFDNFPLSQVNNIVNEKGYEGHPIAFGFDSRTRAFDPDNLNKIASDLKADILYLSATNVELQRRFSETRRKHPLAQDRTVMDGIIHERKWLESLISFATLTIDTTDLSVHDLKHLIESNFADHLASKKMAVTIMSFGFKHGVPREVDMVLDVRFLKNPHWDQDLKPLSGQDEAVQDYIETDDNFMPFYRKITDLVDFLLPNYTAEGKSYFTIAFGCTGGKHRSVYLAEKLSRHVQAMDYHVTTRHRDLR